MHSFKAAEHAHSPVHNSVRATVRKLNAHLLTFFSQREGDLLRLLRQRLLNLATRTGQHSVAQIRSWQNARHFLDTDAVTFSAKFQAALEKSLNDEIQAIAPESGRQRGPITQAARLGGELNLSLVGVAEMDRMLSLDEVAQRFNVRYEETLTALTLRLRALFGREVASLQGNPYRPEVLVRAFLAALKNCALDDDATHAVLLALDPEHCIDLAPLYTELDKILEDAGISAQFHRVRKTRSYGRTPGATGTGVGDIPGQSGFAESMPAGMPSGFFEGVPAGYRGGLVGTMRSGFGANAPMPGHGIAPSWALASDAHNFLRTLAMRQPPTGVLVPQDGIPGSDQWGAWHGAAPLAADATAPVAPYLVRYLEELQANAMASFAYAGLDIDLGSFNQLWEMRGDEEIRNAQEFDRGTVDALAEVFDFVFLDPNIASSLKVIIGRLQIPVLKAALMDRNFFVSPNHPARRLIDALAAAAMAWNPEKGLEDPLYLQIEATIKRVLTEFDQDLALFSEAQLEFEDFLAETERRIRQQVQQLASAQEEEEVLELARAHADALIHERIIALPDDPDRTAFLLPFLTAQWREVLALAYVKQASQPDHWTLLLTTTDQLLWSVQHKRDSAERRQLVAVLPGLVRQLNAGLDALGWEGDERDEFTRRLIATHMNAIRSSVDASEEATPASQDRHAGDEAVRLLDQRLAAAQVAEPDSFDAMARGFERGMWFDFLSDEALSLRCRLSWISPRRGRFLFTNREGFDAFVRSEQEVTDLLRRGRLQPLRTDAVVSRAIDRIMAAHGVSPAT